MSIGIESRYGSTSGAVRNNTDNASDVHNSSVVMLSLRDDMSDRGSRCE